MQHGAEAVGAGHGDEGGGTVEARGLVSEGGEAAQVAARPAAQIENRVRRCALDRLQQGGHVLAYVVVGRAAAVGVGDAVVFGERARRGFAGRRGRLRVASSFA